MSSKPWNERYSQTGFYYGKEPNTFLVEQVSFLPKEGRILCLAEGEGRNAVYLAKQGFKVKAVDFSSVAIEKLKTFANQEGVGLETEIADLADYDLGVGAWDGIVSIWCHLPSSLRRSLHTKCVSALKPGGVFVLEAYTPQQLAYNTGGPKDSDLMPTLELLRSELKELSMKLGREINREIHEGMGHTGTSAVVQFIANKE